MRISQSFVPRRLIGAGIDAAVVATPFVAIASIFAASEVRWLDVVTSIPILLLGLFGFSLPFIGIVLLCDRAEERLSGWLGVVLKLTTSVVLAIVPFGVFPHVHSPATIALVVCSTTLLFASATYWGPTRPHKLAFLFVACTIALTELEGQESVGLLARVEPFVITPPLLIWTSLGWIGLGGAFIIERLFRSAVRSERTSPVFSFLSLAASLLLLFISSKYFQGTYVTLHWVAFNVAVVVTVLSSLSLCSIKAISLSWSRRVLVIGAAILAFLALILSVWWNPLGGTATSMNSRMDPVRKFLKLSGVESYRKKLAFDSLRERVVRRDLKVFSTSPSPRVTSASRSKTYRATNLLLITIDTLRFDHVGRFSGGKRSILTPYIDRLLNDSARFHRASTQGGWTSLALPALHWSKNVKDIHFIPLFEDSDFRLYLRDTLTPRTPVRRVFQSPRDEPSMSLAEQLNPTFKTVAVLNDGLTHYFDPELGFTRGFEELYRPEDELLTGRIRVDSDVQTAGLGVNALHSAGSDPFFLWVHLFGPHVPYSTGGSIKPRLTPYEMDVHLMDRQVGHLLQALDELHLADDTLVILTSDHGEAFGEHGRNFHGLNLHQEVVHVPLAMRGPGISSGDFMGEVGLIDVAPTMLESQGLPVPSSMQGVSLYEAIEEESASRLRPLFFETWRTDLLAGRKDVHQVGVVQSGNKVILDLVDSKIELYHLDSDPGEKLDLFGARDSAKREQLLDLAAQLVQWRGL